MESPVEALFVGLAVSGIVLGGIGYVSYRRWDQLGAGGLAAFALILGLGNSIAGIVGLTTGAAPGDLGVPLWGTSANFFWALAAVPWLLFTLQYTGRYTQVSWRLVALLYAPLLVFVFSVTHSVLEAGGTGIVNAVASIVFIYCFALVFLGAFLLIQSTYSYVHLSVAQGVALAAVPLIVVLAGNSVGMIQTTSVFLATGMYTLTFVLATILFGAALFYDPVLARTPAVETRGTQAITRETDDLICIVDSAHTLVEHNATATETLGDTLAPGEPIEETLAYTTADLETRETITLDTTTGKRRYDPQVSPITDGRGTELGAVLSLRDVTERELREQRLAVLNRVLRHNLRNKVDIVKSHAEVLDDRYDDDHVASITAAADSITDLGSRARSIDQFVSSAGETEQVDLVERLETTIETLASEDSVSITLDLPESAPVETNRQALTGALDSALDNAFTYAKSTVDISLERDDGGYTVVVADDGPGIPDRELQSLDAGTETPLQHGTGLGLWQLRWAVTTMGGDLSFETDDGTTVRFTVPDQGSDAR